MPKRGSPDDARRGFSPRLMVTLTLIVVAMAALILGPGSAAHRWQNLPGVGRIRWAGTRAGAAFEPPVAPGYLRLLGRLGLPVGSDLPLEPLGVSYGGGAGRAAVWYVIEAAFPNNDLWQVDKTTLRLLDAAGAEIPAPGGSGAALIDSDRGLQFVYVAVPEERAERGGHLTFRLVRELETSVEVTLPY